LLIAAPLLAFPFSSRVAKSLLVLAMFVLAFGMLWLAFQSNSSASHPALVQVAAIAFAVMLLARVVLVLRRKRSALGT
jgi:lipopolysaccharide export LptBFGC system permease protein LptF